MSVVALSPGYSPGHKDLESKFHGNRVVYFHWEEHLIFAAPLAFPLPPAMPFGAVIAELLPSVYGFDPDWADVDLSKARWTLNGEEFTPDPAKSLDEHGVAHKSLIRFWT